MSTARERVLGAAGVLLGAMWLVAAGAKIASPSAAFELIARAVPQGVPPKAFLAAAVGVETCLGAAMCLRAVPSLAWSLAGVAAVSVVLLVVRSDMGSLFPCGCFGVLLGSTLDVALARNAVLAAAHAALILWSRRKSGP